MFDISTVGKRYFGIKLVVTDGSDKEHAVQLEVEPPKLKTLKRLVAISKAATEDSMDELAGAVRELLSKNRTKYKVPDEYIDELDYDELVGILTAYFDWLKQSRESPN